MTDPDNKIENAYALAKERYAALGVSTETALARLEKVAISLHCWQGDDVGGFESPGGDLTGGIAATGNYPGKARTADELRKDLDVVYSLLPGSWWASVNPSADLGCEKQVGLKSMP
jgi:L-rhamnose isomerase